MKLVLRFSLLLISLVSITVHGQHSGNSVSNNSYHYNQNKFEQLTERLFLNDSSFVIQAKVLMNLPADRYVATFGVAQMAPTLKEANTKLDERVDAFRGDLNKIGIDNENLYVDMTTQTQISDYKVSGDFAEEFISGYELKKNLIIQFDKMDDLDKMLIAAAEHEIFDLVKVDYIPDDQSAIYKRLFESAMELIEVKKDLYVQSTNVKIKTSSSIYGESFKHYTPTQLYKSYTPNIRAEYYSNSSYSKRKDLRKSPTYYYDPISYSGFDKVIHPVIIEPVMQYTLVLQIKFDTE